jgi:HPt (histidine-containing phosphotransfer) domain-containing protein
MRESYQHIDLSYLEEFSKGDKNFIKEIISISVEQTGDEISNLKSAIEQGAYNQVGRICHKLRSSMGFMGTSPKLIEELKELESSSLKDNKVFKTKTEHIITVCTRINSELKQAFDRLEKES